MGEGIVWDSLSESFLWTDIHKRKFYRLQWPTMRLEQFSLPHRLGSFGLTRLPNLILAAFEAGFASYDFERETCEWICRPVLPPGVRFNDGRVDRAGRFVAGTMVEDPVAAGSPTAGALFRLETSGRVTELLSGIGITNSLCWSPDGSIMYHADSTVGALNAYDYGTQCDWRCELSRAHAPSTPDGATVDAQGRIWVAMWGGARVAVFAADGTLLDQLPVPVTQPTCVALGGQELDVLAVTSAHDGLNSVSLAKETAAGDVFFYRTAIQGLEECRVTV
ncbi:SMP-30/gluconolactonase/LRE family protein [Novosphingobium sp. Gsoil 351]|uniref:SMP-30/gluconolactonase/LRE family protein n=1 Tax=Novosphingobium sp. Gsoil 351 TaxID=2675225 RepID=UPI0018A7F78E|nr:SMP-30/gluconolactonase/LRE family protein [Novosphingobium sp. Gsoil 351]